MTWQTTTTTPQETEDVAALLGARCRGGEVIELVSDLGGGKTTFVRGLARGVGSPDAVASPSFTLSREYRADDKTIYHFDFYRLQEPGIIASELAEFLTDPQAIVVVEWADIVHDVLPAERLTIRLTRTSDSGRSLTCDYPERMRYMIPEKT